MKHYTKEDIKKEKKKKKKEKNQDSKITKKDYGLTENAKVILE